MPELIRIQSDHGRPPIMYDANFPAFRSAVQLLKRTDLCVKPHPVCARARMLMEVGCRAFRCELSHDARSCLTMSAFVASGPRAPKLPQDQLDELQKLTRRHSRLQWIVEDPLLILASWLNLPASENCRRDQLQYALGSIYVTLSCSHLKGLVDSIYKKPLWRDVSIDRES